MTAFSTASRNSFVWHSLHVSVSAASDAVILCSYQYLVERVELDSLDFKINFFFFFS